MRKFFKLAPWFSVCLVLFGTLFLFTNLALAQSEPPPVEPPAEASVYTIDLSLPTFQLGTGQVRGVDLWNYTGYLGNKNNLVYTVTHYSSLDIMTYTRTGPHTYSFTGISGGSGTMDYIHVTVSDGSVQDEATWTIRLNTPPEVDFSSGYDALPYPLWGRGGSSSYMYRTPGTPVALENYLSDAEDYYTTNWNFSIDPSTSISLNAVITEIEGYHYVQFSPVMGMQGRYLIGVVVQDSGELTAVGYFTLSVGLPTHLPIVVRNAPPSVYLNPISNSDGDGSYGLSWKSLGLISDGYDLQLATAADFSNAQTFQSWGTSFSRFDRTPGVYYWRVRVHSSGEPYAWSNVQSVTVEPRAYLYVKPLCAYDWIAEMWGPVGYIREYFYPDCNGSWQYWRSVPTGRYDSKFTWVGTSIVDYVGGTDLGLHDYCLQANAISPAWTMCD